MIKTCFAILLTTTIYAAQNEIAVINLAALDPYAENLLFKSENGIKLLRQKDEIDKLDKLSQANGTDRPYINQVVLLNSVIDSEKRLFLDKFIRSVTDGKYFAVLSDSGSLIGKSDSVKIVDVTFDVIQAIGLNGKHDNSNKTIEK